MSALNNKPDAKMSSFRWVICSLLFFATTVNYMDRQVLSLTWKEFIAPEFHWTDTDYGVITSIFSIIYAVANLFAGRFIDWMGSKKGYLWTIFIWSAGACLHALCGWATEHTLGLHDAAELVGATGALASTVAITSVYYFIAARVILGIGEAGNFPAAIKVTAEYFPKKDRAFATSIFNAGATVGALLAPVSIPALASYFQKAGVGNGWEMAFLIIGGLGFIWMGFWMWLYRRPESNPFVNKAELEYIEQDNVTKNETPAEKVAVEDDRKNEIPFLKCFKYRQTWAIFFGRFLTDGVWWFFLFWTPAYLKIQYNMEGTQIAWPIAILYSITVIGSVFGGKFPTYFINRGMNPYAGRMRAMLIIAFFPLVVLFAQPLGYISYWVPILLISVGASAHQAWSANIFSTVGDMFPKSAIATITGIGGMAGGIGSFFIQKGAGMLFTYSGDTNMQFMGFEGKPAGYAIVFIFCAVAYLIGWIVMKMLVPKYKVITLN